MRTIQQEAVELDGLTREVADAKDAIKRLTKSRDVAAAEDDAKRVVWFDEEIKQHQSVLEVSQNLLAEASGQTVAKKRGRPPLQQRG